MADERNFIYDSNYKAESNFTRVKFGSNTPILETELNEMQILQEKGRTSLVRRLSPSGFIELISKEFTGEPFVFNPSKDGLVKTNHLAIAPCRAIVNGYEFLAEGNFSYTNVDNEIFNNYILVNLGDAPSTGVRDDLVYLEVWFQNLDSATTLKKWGYQEGNIIQNSMISGRVGVETSRRIALYWNIRVAHNVEFNEFPQGFGFIDINRYSPIYAIADGSGHLAINSNLNTMFASAAHDMFKQEEFYRDNNLWIAGRPNYDLNTSSVFGKYVFALPMFRIKRRNCGQYSIQNFNGASISTHTDLTEDSSKHGDLNSNIRPDKRYYDKIYSDDILDLRRSISIKEFNSEYYLDKGLKDLFTGELQTKDTINMRRVQFGKSKQNFSENENIVFAAEFNKTIIPYVPGMENPIYTAVGGFDYKMSVGGYGVLLDNQNYVKYNIPMVSVDVGTVDFLMQPYWDGVDEINQPILSMYSNNNDLIFKFEKQGKELIWSQYSTAINPTINKVIVDLTTNLILANNIYHIRLSWTTNPLINSCFVYINGKLVGQGTYVGSKMIANSLQIGNQAENDDNPKCGFVIEELVAYNRAFEVNVSNSQYSFIDNKFWPNLPPDFISHDTLLYPSFNGILSTFSDNGGIQENTIALLTAEPLQEGDTQAVFILNAPCDRMISGDVSPKVYKGDGTLVTGTWGGLNSPIATFSCDDTSLINVVVQYNLLMPPGFGGMDLPNEILAAGFIDEIKNTTPNGEDYTTYNIREISFNRKGNADPRPIPFINARRMGGAVDAAYDYATERDKTQAFARLLYYNVAGTGYANGYVVPGKLYGYDVLGVMTVRNRKMLKCTKINNTQTQTWTFEVTLDEAVAQNDIIQFVVALGGTTFDYETQSKTLISNICQTKFIKYVATGEEGDDYITIPCFDNHVVNGGILKAAFTFTDNVFDKTVVPKKLINSPSYSSGYFNGEMIRQLPQYDSEGNLMTTPKYEIVSVDIKPESFNTPFLQVKFLTKPTAGMLVEIPILASYQPLETDKISIWYNHIPYQGILSNSNKKLKRISDWKYFMTTLSSGAGLTFNVEEDNIYSLNNIINRLPGGSAYAYIVDGKPIIFNHLSQLTNKENIHSQLMFVEDKVFASKDNSFDKSFFHLDTDFILSKTATGFQDGKLNIQNTDFKVYFPECTTNITKYTGMASLVLDENGEILLFVVGCLNNNIIDDVPSTENILMPIFGDLYRIPTLPTTIQRY